MIANALDAVRWNRRRAARMLGVSYKTLLNKMKTLGLDESDLGGVFGTLAPDTPFDALIERAMPAPRA